MNGKVETSRKHLSLPSKSLNEASDELSKQIAAIESAINQLKLGIWVWGGKPIQTEFELRDPDEKGQRFELNYYYRLGYGKHNAKWGLLVSYRWEADEEDMKVEFFPDTS